MTTDARPRPEKRPPPRLDLTRSEWKLVVTGALGLAWAFAWLALAKPVEVASGPAEITDTGAASPKRAAPRGAGIAPIPAPRRPTAAPVNAPRLAAASRAQRPRAAAIRIRTRAS